MKLNNKISFLILLLLFVCKIFAENIQIERLRNPFGDEANSVYTINASTKDIFIYDLKYRNPKNIVKIIKTLYPDISIDYEPETKKILIKSTSAQFASLAKKIREIDNNLDQIMIEVKVIEVSFSEISKLGLTWNFEDRDINISQEDYELIAHLNLLVGSGKATILANPKITTTIGTEANIHIGDKIPYSIPVESASGKTTWQIQYLDAGIHLSILPEKARSGYINLKLNPEVSSIKQWKLTPNGEFPIISTRRAEAHIHIKNGHSFVIGGLINEEERENIRKVPILGDIPILNIFFKHTFKEKTKTDILFVVTARKV